MLEFLSRNEEDAINILKTDHDKVKDIFDRFEKAENRREKKKLMADALKELKIHAEIEEGLFYPAVRAKIDDKKIMNESDEEHHVAKVLIAELDEMDGDEEHFEAKFTVLAENIRHHIKEEEGQMFPEARDLEIDFEALGQKMLEKKSQLKKQGVPKSPEHKMVAKAGPSADSPAQAALKHKAKPRVKTKIRKPASRKAASHKHTRRKAA